MAWRKLAKNSAFLFHPLPGHQFREEALLFQQLVIGAVLNDVASVQHQNAVTLADGGQPVGNDDAGAAEAVQRLRHLFLGDVVQSAGGLVKNQQLGLGGDGPGNHQPLALPAGDAALALGDQGVHSHGHGPDVVGDAC